jgi:hypothetical protein
VGADLEYGGAVLLDGVLEFGISGFVIANRCIGGKRVCYVSGEGYVPNVLFAIN